MQLEIKINEDKCTACGDCQAICPKGGVIWTIDKVAHVSNLEYCHACTLCVMVCKEEAVIFLRHPGDEEKYYAKINK